MAIDTSDQKITTEAEVVLKEPEVDEDQDIDEDAAPDTSTSSVEPQRQQAGQRKAPAGRRPDRRKGFEEATRQVEERVSARVRQEMQEFQGRFQQMLQARPAQQEQPQRQQAPASDQQVEQLSMALQSEISAAQNHDRSKGPYDFTRYNKIQSEIQRLNAAAGVRAELASMGITPESMRQRQQPQRETYGREAQNTVRFYTLASEHPWVRVPENAKVVGAYRNYLINGLGRPDTLETDREACAHVAAQRGIRSRPAPRGNEQRYAGMRGGDSGTGAAPREVRLPAGALNHLDDDERKRIQAAVFESDA